MTHKITVFYLAVALMLGLVAHQAPAASMHYIQASVWDERVFSPVVEDRTGFIERLKLVVDSQRKQDWETLYNLLFFSGKPEETKQVFVNRLRKYSREGYYAQLLDFTPSAVTKSYPEELIIWGCGRWYEKGQTKSFESAVSATHRDAEWQFSMVSPHFPALDSQPHPCKGKPQHEQRKKWRKQKVSEARNGYLLRQHRRRDGREVRS